MNGFIQYITEMETITPFQPFAMAVEMEGEFEITSTTTNRPAGSATLRLYDIFIPLLGVFIIVLNLLVVVSSGLILKKGQQPRATYLFLGNVGMADLVTGFAVLFGQFYPREHRDEFSCAIQIGMIVSSTITSVYSVGLIGIDRFLYILYGLQYQRYIYPNRARFLILLTWLIGLIVGFLPAMGWRGDTNNGRICWFIVLAPPHLVLLTTVIGILPVFLVLILYSIILHRALQKVGELKNSTSGAQTSGRLRFFRGGGSTNNVLDQIQREEEPLHDGVDRRGRWYECWKRSSPPEPSTAPNLPKQPSKWKAIKVVMLTTGSFFFTWMPYFVASTWYVYCDPQSTPDLCNGLRIAIASPLAILGFANSLLNPIIYAWWHNGFRNSTKKLYAKSFGKLKCCRVCCHNSDENLSSTANNSTSPRSTQLSVSNATTSTSMISNNDNPTVPLGNSTEFVNTTDLINSDRERSVTHL